ncbi:MAG: putative quinol monooxygenase [Aquiluna sp.]|nr:putative quinol monooxygenase [Aquiluna sp.]
MTKETCTVVATIRPTRTELDAVKRFLLLAAEEVRLEDGCIYYDLYEEVGGKLLFIEAWRDRDAWQFHNQAKSVEKIVAFLEGKLEEPTLVQEMYLAAN